MKKLYTSFFLLAFLGVSQLSFGQFYDGFTGTGTIGGNCADATCNENGWYTHSNTSAATIDIISGSLSYSGLQASTGNKVYITGITTTLKRDVNAAAPVTGNVAYYSALVKVLDTTNLSSTGFDYFMCLGNATGNSVTGLGGRLGITSVNTDANFRFGICNTSTGTPTYTDCGQDLTFGTTYLVVVKYDKSTVPTTASLWVNPTTLGGAEPAGSVSNNSGTASFATFASICIRNGYAGTPVFGGTPNAEIDEIRVGATFASVTPMSTGINEVSNINKLSVFPIPATSTITVSANVPMNQIQIFDLQGRIVKEMNNINANETQMDVNSLTNGVYNVVATSKNGNVFNSKLIK
jgi:hypothetical protein